MQIVLIYSCIDIWILSYKLPPLPNEDRLHFDRQTQSSCYQNNENGKKFCNKGDRRKMAEVYLDYLVKHPFRSGDLEWLGEFPLILAVTVGAQKLSSISRTFARRDFEETSFLSISLSFFCIRILFLVIFSPGRDILSIHGIHCKNILCTFDIVFVESLLCISRIS